MKAFKRHPVSGCIGAAGGFCFSHFTHTFQKGKKYAIIGPSGVGKSTILNLLMQYIVPDQGKICIDGNSISGKDSSKIIVCVNQFEHIFHASFTQNATLFESYPMSRMRSALRYFDNEKLNSLLQKRQCPGTQRRRKPDDAADSGNHGG